MSDAARSKRRARDRPRGRTGSALCGARAAARLGPISRTRPRSSRRPPSSARATTRSLSQPRRRLSARFQRRSSQRRSCARTLRRRCGVCSRLRPRRRRERRQSGGVARAARARGSREVHSDLGASVVDACWLTHPNYANEFFEGASDVQRFRADGRDAALDVLTTLAEVACDLGAPGRLAARRAPRSKPVFAAAASPRSSRRSARRSRARCALAARAQLSRDGDRASLTPFAHARSARRGAARRARPRRSRARGEASRAPRAPGAAERARRALRLWRRRKHARALLAARVRRASARHPRRARACARWCVVPRACECTFLRESPRRSRPVLVHGLHSALSPHALRVDVIDDRGGLKNSWAVADADDAPTEATALPLAAEALDELANAWLHQVLLHACDGASASRRAALPIARSSC